MSDAATVRRDVLDVAIVGGGLAGSALAAVLAGQGHSVALCDLHETYPVDFRAEKLTAGRSGATTASRSVSTWLWRTRPNIRRP